MGLVESLITQATPATWWLFGLALLVGELVLPGMVLVWFGVAALAVGAILLFAPLIWQAQLVAWVGLSVVLLLVGRRWFRRAGDSADPLMNERARRFVGRVFTLTEPLVEGSGRIRIDDTIWRVSGPDLPAGTRIAVTGVDGSVLRVDKAG